MLYLIGNQFQSKMADFGVKQVLLLCILLVCVLQVLSGCVKLCSVTKEINT